MFWLSKLNFLNVFVVCKCLNGCIIWIIKKNNDKFWYKFEMRKKMIKKVRLDI